jgi:hypothetical protein
MSKDELIAYCARWNAVAEIEEKELRRESIETKWKKLRSIINLAIGLGLFKADQTEGAIYKKWAELKEKVEQQSR